MPKHEIVCNLIFRHKNYIKHRKWTTFGKVSMFKFLISLTKWSFKALLRKLLLNFQRDVTRLFHIQVITSRMASKSTGIIALKFKQS